MTTHKPHRDILKPVPAPKSGARMAAEKYLEDNSGAFTAMEIADATGYTASSIRGVISTMVQADIAVNVTGPSPVLTKYRHRNHIARSVTRREPITNNSQPNGCQEYWEKHVAAMNTPARRELHKP